MGFVYFLQDVTNNKIYVGSTNNIKRRLSEHKNSKNGFIRNQREYKLICYISVTNIKKARALEKYFKTGSGRAFFKKRILSDEA